MRRRIAGYFGLGLLATAAVADDRADGPRNVDYAERVEVRLVQVDVAVWPRNDDPASCTGLGPADFELLVRGKPREIVAVDPRGSVSPAAVSETDRVPDALSIVLYFDLWHLDMFWRVPTCPRTKVEAFEQARRIVREHFRPGDRLALATFAGWPVVHTGWITDRESAERAIDALEVSPAVVGAQIEHSHHKEWMRGLESLVLALGRYPGGKDLFWFGDDVAIDDVEAHLYELAAAAQANRVTLYATDLISGRCREVLADRWAKPVIHGPLSSYTGGRMFGNGLSAGQGIAKLRELSGCRYVVSFRADAKEGKGRPPITVRTRRPGLEIRTPAGFEDPRHAPNEREKLEALFLLPDLRRGVVAEAGLWPLRPTGEGQNWKALVLLRVYRDDGDSIPDDMTELSIRAGAYRQGKAYTELRKTLAGAELQRWLESGEGKLWVLPIEVKPGPTSVTVTVEGAGGEVAASYRSEIDVPAPPQPGQAHPWFLVDRLGQAGDETTLLPSLSGLIHDGRPPTILGYGCRPSSSSPGSESWHGSLVQLDGHGATEIPIGWLDPEALPASCGWLVGHAAEPLAAGWWRFDPPSALASGDWRGPLSFRVAAPPSGPAN